MKLKETAAFFGALALFGLMVAGFVGYPPKAHALAKALGEIKTATVTCATSATEIVPTDRKKNSMMLINTTATAAYVGGSNVDGSTAGTTGIDVCDGCSAGKTLSVDASRAWCVSSGGAVVLEIVYAQ